MGGTAEGWAALEKQQAEEEERNWQIVRDRLVQVSADTYGHASAYDNAVMVAGYAAFFALWSGVSGELSPVCRLVTASLMGMSLMFYIGWQVANMIVRQKFDAELGNAFALTNEPSRFNAAWQDISSRKQIAIQRMMRFWLFVLVPSIVFGFAAGATLSYNALAVALGWPQLVG